MTEQPQRAVPAEHLLVALLLAAAVVTRLGLPALAGWAPPGLFRDEWEKGYTALELWETGRHGVLGAGGVTVSRFLPLFIEVFEGHDRTSAIYQYLSAPVVGLLGLTAFSTRLVAALAGVLTCLALWGFARRLLGPVAALGALAAAVLHPTGLVFSLWAQQGVLVPLLTMGGFHALLVMESSPRHRRAAAAAGVLLLALAAYAYDPARLVVPLWLAAWVALRWTVWPEGRRWLLGCLVATGMLCAPLVLFTLTAGSARLDRVALEGSAAGRVGAFFGNFLAHFHPAYWTWEGDSNPRHGLPSAGFAGGALTALALLGACRSVLGREAFARSGILVLWLLAAPVAAALTKEGSPHSLRSILLVPASALLAGVGVEALLAGGAAWRRGLLALLAVGQLGQATAGLALLGRSAGGPWQAGVIEGLRAALTGTEGRVFLDTAVPYAPYAALFAEQTDPHRWQELGPAAWRTRLSAPGQMPALRPGDVLVAPPGAGIPLELLGESVLLYRIAPDGSPLVGIPPRPGRGSFSTEEIAH